MLHLLAGLAERKLPEAASVGEHWEAVWAAAEVSYRQVQWVEVEVVVVVLGWITADGWGKQRGRIMGLRVLEASIYFLVSSPPPSPLTAGDRCEAAAGPGGQTALRAEHGCPEGTGGAGRAGGRASAEAPHRLPVQGRAQDALGAGAALVGNGRGAGSHGQVPPLLHPCAA